MKYTIDYIQLQAYDQTVTPDPECPVPERALWWSLRDIYARFRSGVISKEQGEQQKQNAMRCYQKDKEDYDSMRKLIKHQAEMWSRIEQTGNAYAKSDNRSPEADAFYSAVYGTRPESTEPLARG